MADSLEDKKHPASELRRRRAKEEGLFPHSPEWNGALVWLIGIAILEFSGARSFEIFSGLIFNTFSDAQVLSVGSAAWYPRLCSGVAQAMMGVIPIFFGLFCVGLAVQFAQVGFVFKPERLAWDWGRVVPRIGVRLGGDLCVWIFWGVLKLGLVIGVVGCGIWFKLSEIVLWSELPLARAAGLGWEFLLGLGWRLGFGWLILAGLDYGWRWWSYERRLRMTDSELREELRESQGDIGTKSRRRKLFSGGRTARVADE